MSRLWAYYKFDTDCHNLDKRVDCGKVSWNKCCHHERYIPSPWRKHLRRSPLHWSKIRTEPSSLPLMTQLPCMPEVTCKGTLLRMEWRKDWSKVGETPGETLEIEYASIPLTRLEIKRDCWSWEKVVYPLKKKKIIQLRNHRVITTYFLVGISVTHFSLNGSRL